MIDKKCEKLKLKKMSRDQAERIIIADSVSSIFSDLISVYNALRAGLICELTNYNGKNGFWPWPKMVKAANIKLKRRFNHGNTKSKIRDHEAL